jgi:hypothetical protein
MGMKKKPPRMADCHPDRLHKGHGLCLRCWAKQRYDKNSQTPEFKAKAQRYRDRHRAKLSSYHKNYYRENREQLLSDAVAYREKNKDQILADARIRSKVRSRTFRGKYSELKRSAKYRGWGTNISMEQYEFLLKQGQGRCFYCGGPLHESGHGLDRLDNRLGYLFDNVVLCCAKKNGSIKRSCNFRKGLLEGAGFTYPRTKELLMELLAGEKDAVCQQETKRLHGDAPGEAGWLEAVSTLGA